VATSVYVGKIKVPLTADDCAFIIAASWEVFESVFHAA